MTSVAQPKDKAESTKVPVPSPIQAIGDAKDRTDADRQLDAETRGAGSASSRNSS
jgi:hypothetical protein